LNDPERGLPLGRVVQQVQAPPLVLLRIE